jgi:hypothetical protein
LNSKHHLRRPTKHYDENVLSIDEQICKLIADRKTVSNNNPGFPPIEQIEFLAEKYGLFEKHLHSIFSVLYNEQFYRPKVEPNRFLGIKPIMKFAETDSKAYLVTHLRQYENATVLYFQVDSKLENQEQGHRSVDIEWELSLGPEYDCYTNDGSGNNQQWTQRFVISPRLPDEIKDLTFSFKWKERKFNDESEIKSGEIQLR